MTVDHDTALAELRQAAGKYAKANAARTKAMDELRDTMRAADEAGVSRNEIERSSGLARATVYRIVDAER